MKTSIVIPVYNEARTVAQLIDKVRELAIDKELIVVNDGSSDGTRDALKPFENVPGIRVHHSPVNLGKGASVRIGFSLATGDVIAIQDADLELDPNELLKLIEPITDGRADVVFGSRFLGMSLFHKKGSLPFYLANRGLSAFASMLYGARLTDIETCYKVFRRDALAQLTLKAARFELEPELCAQVVKKGLRLVEMPIGYNPRSKADGKKISWRDGVHAVMTLIDQKLKQ
jgi:glycosyltransferase involved in cell wall biosynthesis